MQAAHTYALMHPHTIRDTGFWTECWYTLEGSLSSLARRTRRPWFPTECQIWTCLTIEHFSTLKQSILNEPWPTGHGSVSGPCSHMASFLHDRALVGICRWHGGLCLLTVVSGSILLYLFVAILILLGFFWIYCYCQSKYYQNGHGIDINLLLLAAVWKQWITL